MIDQKSTLILGANGQVGRRLAQLLPHATALARKEADLSNPDQITALLNEYKPKIILNAAAYTAVDLAEKEPELAHTINAESPGKMAEWCAENNAVFVHYSTDYVFPGKGMESWKENNGPGPLNEYGKSKLAGEQKILKTFYHHGLDRSQFFIFRTSWVYDAVGKNFVLTMLKLGADRESLNVVSDQVGAPTFAKDIAAETIRAVEKGLKEKPFPSGVYHFCQSGEASWFLFAEEIFGLGREKNFELKVKTVNPIRTEDYPTPAKRPLNSRLDCTKLEEKLGIKFRDWKIALNECLDEIQTRYHTS